MQLITCKPSPPLSCYVESLWHWESHAAPHRQERVLPSGRSQLIIDLSDGFSREVTPGVSVHQAASAPIVVGLQTQFAVLETAALQWLIGAVFRPGGARAIVDVPADDYSDQVMTLDAIWGASAVALRDRLREAPTVDERLRIFEAALLQRAQRRQLDAHAAVRYGLATFERAPHIQSVLDVARHAGLSRRRFSELFREQVGLTPKLYCRVLRFQRVVQHIASGGMVDWKDVALAGGFCDQAHLAHEFRQFSGISLTTYVNTPRTHANHVVLT